MANPTTQEYSSGQKLIAGIVTTEQENLAADVYYRGMPLKYVGVATVGAITGTGNGTVTALSADANVQPGAYVLTMTAALVAQLANSDGEIIAGGIALIDAAATKINVNGIHFTVTDGATPFGAGAYFTITVSGVGSYAYDAGGPFNAFYNGPTKTLSSAGYGSIITSGEIYEGGIVDDSGDALTITDGMRAQMRSSGFAPRQVG
jgi:hypothetical protein